MFKRHARSTHLCGIGLLLIRVLALALCAKAREQVAAAVAAAAGASSATQTVVGADHPRVALGHVLCRAGRRLVDAARRHSRRLEWE